MGGGEGETLRLGKREGEGEATPPKKPLYSYKFQDVLFPFYGRGNDKRHRILLMPTPLTEPRNSKTPPPVREDAYLQVQISIILIPLLLTQANSNSSWKVPSVSFLTKIFEATFSTPTACHLGMPEREKPNLNRGQYKPGRCRSEYSPRFLCLRRLAIPGISHVRPSGSRRACPALAGSRHGLLCVWLGQGHGPKPPPLSV